MLCIRATPFGSGVATPEARLRLVGRYVEDLGSASPADYLSAVRSLFLGNVALRARLLEAAMRSAQGAPAEWTADARAYLDAMRDALTTDAYYAPADLREGRSLDAAVALGQEILRSFGRLLQCWPDVVAAARVLASEGVVLPRAL